MTCPYCRVNDDKVLESRNNTHGSAIRRRRKCNNCGYRFTSYEKIEEKPLMIIKKDNTRQAFDKDKLLRGISISLKKRPVSSEAIQNVLNEIEDSAEAAAKSSHEIDSTQLGEMALKHLYQLDKVAYIRFASVYRSFEDVEEFKSEIDRIHNL